MEIADITSSKRQASQGNSQPNKKPTLNATKGTSPSNLNMHDLWLGFQNMEMLAIDLSVEPYAYSLEACLQAGIPSKEACELVSAQIAFPSILQQLWPFSRNDNVPGQQYHLTQISFHVEVDSLTGYARTYQILLHFEKPLKPYTSKEIVELVTKRFQKMDIALGNILEPIALLCSRKDSTPWNGMEKVHLKHPSKDAEALLTGNRVFTMEFDDCLRVPKISKSFDNTAPKKLLAIQIQGDNLKMIVAHQIMAQVVFTSFHHGQKFEIIQVNKNKQDNFAYLTTVSPEQCKKVITHQVLFNREILTPNMASTGAVTKKEIQRRNCLTLIVKDCNLYYFAREVRTALKQLIGDNNVVNTYFKDGDVEKNQHARVCNLEVLNPTVYKQYIKTTTKILSKYVTFRPHPRSLDGTSAPHEDVLKEFGFLDVNNAIVGAMTAIANQATSSQPSGMSFAIVTELIKANAEQTKMEIRKDLEVMRTEVTADAHTYVDIIVDDLKLTLDAKF